MFTDNPREVSLPKSGTSPRWGVDLSDPKHSLIACNCQGDNDKAKMIAQADIDAPSKQYPMEKEQPKFTFQPGKENIIVFAMDLSKSMIEAAGTGLEGETKFDVAKSALNKTLATILAEKERLEKQLGAPLDVKFEVRVFGFPLLEDAHQQTMVRLPLRPLTQDALDLLSADETLWKPTGCTPTTSAVQQINEVDLRDHKDANVILNVITDGAETEGLGKTLCDYYRDVWHPQHSKWPVQLIFQNMTDAAAILMSKCLEKQGALPHQEAYDEDSLVNGMLHGMNMDLHGVVLPVQKKPNDRVGN
jgi:hypothetical protein